ncbi:WhiB family transcriptional regulator [Rhodococcus opacus]|uniref:WhiB family transcriptional regulator n=1 Tax=Rhodococcus opacus TaxID=37919 RepID=UPI0024731488|nr:WhiB family transcriptional regulator [Rhodococcus opacus]MDH6290859.1 hypothetical protein [Rhodococcus opacus]
MTAVEEVMTDLERLGVPVTATRAEAQQSLRRAGRGVSTDRLRAALNSRRSSAGVPSRNRSVATLRNPEGRRKHKAPPVLTNLVDDCLIGAACVGLHHLFDDRHDGEQEPQRAARHQAAVRFCISCPVLTACRDVAAEHAQYIEGVWAGVIPATTHQEKP